MIPSDVLRNPCWQCRVRLVVILPSPFLSFASSWHGGRQEALTASSKRSRSKRGILLHLFSVPFQLRPRLETRQATPKVSSGRYKGWPPGTKKLSHQKLWTQSKSQGNCKGLVKTADCVTLYLHVQSEMQTAAATNLHGRVTGHFANN